MPLSREHLFLEKSPPAFIEVRLKSALHRVVSSSQPSVVPPGGDLASLLPVRRCPALRFPHFRPVFRRHDKRNRRIPLHQGYERQEEQRSPWRGKP